MDFPVQPELNYERVVTAEPVDADIVQVNTNNVCDVACAMNFLINLKKGLSVLLTDSF
jgi:hypothetical protein